MSRSPSPSRSPRVGLAHCPTSMFPPPDLSKVHLGEDLVPVFS